MSAARHRKFPDRPTRSLMRWSMAFRVAPPRFGVIPRCPASAATRSRLPLRHERRRLGSRKRLARDRHAEFAGGSKPPQHQRSDCQNSLPEQTLGVRRIVAPDRAEAASYRQLQFDLSHVAHPDTRVAVSMRQNPALHATTNAACATPQYQVAELRLPHPSRRRSQDARRASRQGPDRHGRPQDCVAR
jgi:hypothetical protein